MKKAIVCTLCPNGCEIAAEYSGHKDIIISGNRCKKGYNYAVNECFNPRRTFTGSVDIAGNYRRRISVRSNKPIPKDRLFDCAELLREIKLEAPVDAGYIVIKNIFDSGADIVTTMSLGKER